MQISSVQYGREETENFKTVYKGTIQKSKSHAQVI